MASGPGSDGRLSRRGHSPPGQDSRCRAGSKRVSAVSDFSVGVKSFFAGQETGGGGLTDHPRVVFVCMYVGVYADRSDGRGAADGVAQRKRPTTDWRNERVVRVKSGCLHAAVEYVQAERSRGVVLHTMSVQHGGALWCGMVYCMRVLQVDQSLRAAPQQRPCMSLTLGVV